MLEKLKLLIRAGNPLVSIVTTDEPRAVRLVRDVAGEIAIPVYEWSLTTGLRSFGEDGILGQPVLPAGPPLSALRHVRDSPQTAIYVFKDLGPHCRDANIHRTMRDLLSEFANVRSTMIMVDALPLPDEIKRFTVRFDVGWPTAEELEEVVKKTFRRIKDESLYEVTGKITKRDAEQLIQTLRGLSCEEAERVVASAIYSDYKLDGDDLPQIVEAKRTLLGNAGCLESIAADFTADDIGGLTQLKHWLRQRRGGFTRQAKEYGLEPPRGMLMLGVPGCGKSLCAKVVAADWKMPLLRLDPGVLYQKFIGESENQLRQALLQAESMSPVILWIDEIEKAFASASSSSADGGLSKRMFGTLLSWMQDHRHPIFIIATANDISALPPELMRKGRFDEVFFVDLPEEDARQRIFEIHIQRRKRNPENFDLRLLAEAAEGFGGAEIEQAVIAALFSAFSEKAELADRHVLGELRRTRPISVVQGEQIEQLRRWARDRCVSAE